MLVGSGVLVGVGVGTGVRVGVGSGVLVAVGVGTGVSVGIAVGGAGWSGGGSGSGGHRLHRSLDFGLNGGPDVGCRSRGLCCHRLSDGSLHYSVYVRGGLGRGRLRAACRQQDGRGDQEEAYELPAPGTGMCKEVKSSMGCPG